MRLIINIDNDDYEKMKDGHIPFSILKVMETATPIPDNATNGDVIKAFYPELVVGSNNLGKVIFLRPNATVVIEDRMSDWWNSPYQKGGK